MNVKELRKLTGLSQSKFANKFHIHPMNISHWEREDRKPPEYVTYMIQTILEQEKRIEELEHERRKETETHTGANCDTKFS